MRIHLEDLGQGRIRVERYHGEQFVVVGEAPFDAPFYIMVGRSGIKLSPSCRHTELTASWPFGTGRARTLRSRWKKAMEQYPRERETSDE